MCIRLGFVQGSCVLKHRGNFTLYFAVSFAALSRADCGATLAAAGVKAPPGDSRGLLASLAAHSRGYRRGFAAGAGGSGTLSPGISASLAPLLRPRHFSSFQCLELLIPIPTGSQAAQRGNVSDCRSAAGAQRRGKPRGKGKLEQKH